MGYEKRIVAFIDILGFKKSIDNSNTNEEEFTRILETLTELTDFFTREVNGFNIGDTQIVQVSDSLVISRPATEKGGVYSMLTDCAFAIHLLIGRGFLCRGAIKIGNMYHKGTTLFGEAFVRAYLAEENEKLPIIKFDKELFEIIQDYPNQEGYENWEVNFVSNNCKQIMTGIYYLDYFTDYDNRVGGGEGTASIHYSKLREILANGLEMIPKTSNAYEKIRWATDQFNLTAENYELNRIE